MKKYCFIALFIWLCVPPAFSQMLPGVDSYTSEQLTQLAQSLHAEADASNGTATRILSNYPGHHLMLIYRDRTGEVELHQQFADIMYILSGRATLLTGGTIQDGKIVKQGEIRGKSIIGGSPLLLKPGVLAHISANTPHQVLVPAGTAITYLVVKVQGVPPDK